MAYNSHDVDDGLRAGLLSVDELRQVAMFERAFEEARADHGSLSGRRLIHEIVRRLIGYLVDDLVDESRRRLREADPRDLEAVRLAGKPLVGFSQEMASEHRQLKKFLLDRLYRHPRVLRMTTKAKRTVTRLFDAFAEDLRLMPREFALLAESAYRERGEDGRLRVVADYIAGMTDRYAIREYQRLFDPAQPT